MARTLKDFETACDAQGQAIARIGQALALKYREHPENWLTEGELCALAKVAHCHMPKAREKLARHIVSSRAGGKHMRNIWFASVTVADKARGDK